MPRTANLQTPGAVLQSFIDDYQINAFSLSKSIKVAYQSVTNILKGKGRISVQIALRLARYFGNSPEYWLNVQSSSEIDKLSADKNFVRIIQSIPSAKKTAGKTKKIEKTKTGNNKTKTLAEKRKKAAKVPGAKKTRGKKAGRPPKK